VEEQIYANLMFDSIQYFFLPKSLLKEGFTLITVRNPAKQLNNKSNLIYHF